MHPRPRVGLLILLVVSVLGAWLVRVPLGEAEATSWNPYDPVGEVVPPTSASDKYMRAVEEYRGYVYLLGRSGNLYIYDTRDLPTLTTFATYAVPIATVDVGVGDMLLRNGTWLYACGDGGLAVINLANPARPILSVPPDGNGAYNMFQSGERLFLAGGGQATIYSLTDPSRPVAIGSYNAGGKLLFAVAADADLAYVSEFAYDVSGGVLRVLDISDPAHPTSVGAQSLPDLPYHLRLLNGQLIAANSGSVSLFSLANPREPQLLDTQVAGARVCVIDGGNVVVGRRVFRPSGDRLIEVASFAAGQGQGAGYPYGSAVGSGYVLLTETYRARILKGAAAPEDWPYHVHLPIARRS